MKYIFLGTATSQGVPVIACKCDACLSLDPKDKRLRTSMLLQGKSKNYLIDAGPDLRAQMLAQDVQQLNAVFLTHEHTDHMIGLDDLRPFVFKQKQDMPIYALDRVVNEVKKRFEYAFAEKKYLGAPRFEMIPIQFDEIIRLPELKIKVIKVHHGSLEIAGFIINDFLVYITDAKRLSPEVIAQIKGHPVLVISALRKKEHHSHLTLDEALVLCDIIGAEKSYLTHLSHLMGKASDLEDLLPNNVSVAYDNLELNVEKFM